VRILVAEDDGLLGDAITEHLRHGGHAVDWVRDGIAADAALRSQSFQLVVLDLGLPRMSGRDVLAHLRARAASTPVLIITAADAIADRVAGLDAGADDYLVKPFELAELEARVRALIRRSHGHDRNV
jgi:two-component system OmpR family response regulator